MGRKGLRHFRSCGPQMSREAQTQSTPVDDHVDGGPRRPRPTFVVGVVAVEGANAMRQKSALMRLWTD